MIGGASHPILHPSFGHGRSESAWALLSGGPCHPPQLTRAMQVDEQTFRFWHPVEVRFRDIDIGGHAHHSEALIFFEEARSAYWREIVGRGEVGDIDFILAEARIRYLQRVLYPDRLEVGARVSLLGKKHFEMDYLVKSSDGRHLVSGQTVQIMYDYEAGSTKRIPDDIRQRIESAEGLEE